MADVLNLQAVLVVINCSMIVGLALLVALFTLKFVEVTAVQAKQHLVSCSGSVSIPFNISSLLL